MAASVTTFWAPKAGCTEEEWEDAFCCDPHQGRFSVADGASESSFSAAWARLLVEGFVANPVLGPALPEWVHPLQEVWARGMEGRTLAWYAEEKARNGAFSSLLGVSLDEADGLWRAVAVGDSNLFALRQGRLIASFPLDRASEFNTHPHLISSVDRANNGVWSTVREWEGDCRPGDVLMLMTDALAAWFLSEAENRRRPWAALERIDSPEGFRQFLEFARAGRAMRNDDATYVRIEVES